MTQFTMLIGLPASGKTTLAKSLKTELNAVILSSDEIRAELYGDAENQEHNPEVFNHMNKLTREYLQKGTSVIYDATNINYKKRMNLLKQLPECQKECILVMTQYEQCLINNLSRERRVPTEVIKRMYRSFVVPYYYEGWDDIKIHYSFEYNDATYYQWLKDADNFNQENYHHTLLLGDHMRKTAEHVLSTTGKKDELYYAACIHDIGKMKTQTKTKVDKQAHYFGHQNVGAYDSFFFTRENCDLLKRAILIQWHMLLYTVKIDTNVKWQNLLGDSLINQLQILFEGDKLAK